MSYSKIEDAPDAEVAILILIDALDELEASGLAESNPRIVMAIAYATRTIGYLGKKVNSQRSARAKGAHSRGINKKTGLTIYQEKRLLLIRLIAQKTLALNSEKKVSLEDVGGWVAGLSKLDPLRSVSPNMLKEVQKRWNQLGKESRDKIKTIVKKHSVSRRFASKPSQ